MGCVCAPGSGVMDEDREKSTDVVTHRHLRGGSYEIEIDGKLWPASLHITPPYDPKSSRL